MEPTICIITPTLNIIENEQIDAFTLLVALLDIQTYPNVEHLVIDGGSTDGTVELLKDYKNKGFLNFFSEKDTGKFSALNKGIMRTKAKYVAFLSVDDFFHDITGLYDVVNLMEANEADFSFSPAYCRHPEGFVFLFEPAIYNAFQTIPCARQGMVFKRSVLEKVNYFDERFKIVSDMDLIIRLLMKKVKGIYFDGNYTTYKLGQKVYSMPEKTTEETKLVYIKNFKPLIPMNEEILDRMANFSKFPPQLLEKLSVCFPPEDKELFLERNEQMHKIRLEAYQNSKKQ